MRQTPDGLLSHIVIPGALGRVIIEALLTRLPSGNWNVMHGEARSAVRQSTRFDDFRAITCHSMTPSDVLTCFGSV
jgi:hypothetical protein